MAEAFFAPCTRMHDPIQAWNDNPANDAFVYPEDFEEVELQLRAEAGNGAVVDFDFLYHPDFTFDDLWDPTRSKIVWISREIFVATMNGNIGEFCLDYGRPLFSVTSDNSDGENKLQVYSRSVVTDVVDATSTTAYNYVFQLMTWSNTSWTHLKITALLSISIDTLSQFLNSSRDRSATICVRGNFLSELSDDPLRDYLRVFEVSTGPHHQIELHVKQTWDQERIVIIAAFLERCQCAVILRLLDGIQTVPALILDALRGDCNIVELQLQWMPGIDGLVRALAENQSLVRLAFGWIHISDDNWTVLCHSLSRHPKLEFLRLVCTFLCEVLVQHSNERKTRRTNSFLTMLQANTALQELDTPRTPRTFPNSRDDEFDERILSDIIQPYVRRLPHVRAFGSNRGPGYDKLLARALHKVCDNPALVWTLIRSSIPTILDSREDD